MRKQKTDFVAELTTLIRQVKSQPETTKRPNKWRAMWIKDVGSMLTRYSNVLRRAVKAEAQLAKLAE